jgi:hypothetical protein
MNKPRAGMGDDHGGWSTRCRHEDVGRPDSLEAVSYQWVNLLGVESRFCWKSTLGSDARIAFAKW